MDSASSGRRVRGRGAAGEGWLKPLLRLSRADRLGLAYIAATAGAIGVYGWSGLSIGLPTALYVALVADGIARPGSGVLYPMVTHGPRDGDLVSLNFDDGPDPEVTPNVLDALARHDARATFFTIGRSLEAQPELARRMIAEGHELGNHSWRHSRWQNFSSSGRHAAEIQRGAEAVMSVTGSTAQPLYRPPIGLISPALARAAQRMDLTMVAWSLRSHDTRTEDPEFIAHRVLMKIRPGDIVLMHDGHDLPGRHRPVCAKAVPLILEGLRQKGLRCVTVSDLLSLPGRTRDPHS